MKAIAALFALALLTTSTVSDAEVTRYAVLIGHNQGAADEADLRFAEADAAKVRDVLIDLGGFAAHNVVLLQGQNANAARRALVEVNDRIRNDVAGSQALLFVYYSGHADASALHLGGQNLKIDELEKLVRGSAATTRLLVLDSCRSGALTRVKGGRKTDAFRIDLDERLASEGAVFLTSSSASEDAQESDRLRGSFFTHYLVSGLLGAADEDGDGAVELSEAYRYAADHTLRASSRTLAGLQHPTFRYQLAGRGEIVLTRLDVTRRGFLAVPPGRSYLVMEGSENGAVVAEVGVRDRRRRVSLRPGTYFVRGRARSHLLEGSARVSRGATTTVTDGSMKRIEYARLVRKGGPDVSLARVHGPVAGVRASSPMANAESMCIGGFAGYLIENRAFDVGTRLGWCRGDFENTSLSANIDQFELDILLRRSFDLPTITIAPTIGFGGALLWQRFDTRGIAPARRSAAIHVDAAVAASVDLPAGAYALVDVAAQTFFFRQQGRGDDFTASFAGRISLGFGLRL